MTETHAKIALAALLLFLAAIIALFWIYGLDLRRVAAE
jgi:hypothetical protein